MGNVMLLFKNSYKLLFKKKSRVFVYLILPVMIFCGFRVLDGSGNVTMSMGIIDHDKTQMSKDLLEYFEAANDFEIVKIDESQLKEEIAERKVDFALIVPKGFQENVYNGKLKELSIMSIKGEAATFFIEEYGKFYLENLSHIYKASNGDKVKFDEIYNGFRNEGIKVKSVYINDKFKVEKSTHIAVGMFAMFVLIAGSSKARFILKDKRMRTYQRICTTPVSAKEYLLANILVNITLVMMQIILVLFITCTILKIDMYVKVTDMFIILACFGLASVGLNLLIVTLSNSTYTASMLSTLIITPTCMLGGCYWPRFIMPEFFQRIGAFIPQTWVMDALEKLQAGKSLEDVLVNILIMIAFAVVFFLGAIYKMKRSEEVESFV